MTEAARPGADCHDLSVELDLHPALSVLGFFDGVYIVVSELPMGARLSAGRCNGDFSWSLLPEELDGLRLTLSNPEFSECVLTVSVVTPDPLGYDFASTTAQFNVFVSAGTSTVPFNSLRRVESVQHGDWTRKIQRARGSQAACNPATAQPATGDPSADDKRLADAQAEWRAEEEFRLGRTRARWEAEAEAKWVQWAAELARRHEQDLRDNETRWRGREGERVAVADANWSARLAANEIRWRAEEAERIGAAIAQLQERTRTERWRRVAGWLLFSVTIGSMVLA